MSLQKKQLLVGVILAVMLLGLFFRGVDWSALGRALRNAHPLPLVGVVVVTIATYAVRTWRWGDLLAPLDRVGYADLFSATMVGFASGLLVPRAGELLRPWLISRRYHIPTSAGFATIIIERLIDLITVLFLFALYLFVLPTPATQIENRLMEMINVAGASAGAMAVGILGFLLALHAYAERMVANVDRLLARAPGWLAGPLDRLLRTFSSGLAVLRAPVPHLVKIGLQSILLWLLDALALYLNNLAFGIDLPFHATFLLIAFLVVGVAIPTPGMVGGFHAFYLLALSEVYGIDRATAVAAGIAAHALTNLPVLVFGLALLGREGLSIRGAAEVTSRERERKLERQS
jgi:glycosyltransferase 2 family protein